MTTKTQTTYEAVCDALDLDERAHAIRITKETTQAVTIVGTLLKPSEWRALIGKSPATLPDGRTVRLNVSRAMLKELY